MSTNGYIEFELSDGTLQKVRATGKHVIVERLPLTEQTAGGIFIPDAAQMQYMEQEGWVRSLGLGSKKSKKTGKWVPHELKIGDRILWSQYSDAAKRLDPAGKYAWITADDVLAVLKSGEE